MLQLLQNRGTFLRAALAVACMALCCACMPLETPSPFVLRSWPHIEHACSGTGTQTTACMNAIIRASASEQPTAMLVASASWRHAQGDVYGSAHALRSALALLDSSSNKSAAIAIQSTLLFQEIMHTLQRVLDIATPPPLRPPPTPSLSTLYPAQITPFSEFAAALLSVCRNLPALRVVVEVGSGAGAGASSAIIAGILRRPGRLDSRLLACLIEVGAERRARLTQRYAHLPFVRIIAASAVPLSAFPSAADVSAAHAAWSSPEFSVSDALKWRQEDWDYLQLQGTVHDGIGIALAAARALVGGAAEVLLGGDAVDVAVLDGSEFCGWQELSQLYGARIIALDDTRALKHRRSREFLQASGCYTVLADRLHDRNGWAIFERAPGSVCAPFPP
jgi:hypothetical protein